MIFRISLLILTGAALAVLSHAQILSPEALAILVVGGLFAGLAAGIFGIGGGIVMVPTLNFALAAAGVPAHLCMHMALATSLAVILPAGAAAGLAQWKRKAVDVPLFQAMAPGVFVGALVGAFAAHFVSGGALKLFFSIFLIVIGARMALAAGRSALPRKILPPFPLGLIVGLFSALLGIGGGTLTVPLLGAAGVPIHIAIATSSALGVVVSIPGAGGYMLAGWGMPGLPLYAVGYVYLPAMLILVPLAVLMAPYGVAFSHKVPADRLKRLFGVLLLIVAVKMLLSAV